jgi:hypothetical protein
MNDNSQITVVVDQLNIPIYNNVIHVYLYPNEIKEATDILEKKYSGVNLDDCMFIDAFVYEFINKTEIAHDLVMVLPFNVKNKIIAHEAIHAAWNILEFAGVTINNDNHEALAYLVGFLIDGIETILENHISCNKM